MVVEVDGDIGQLPVDPNVSLASAELCPGGSKRELV
jgi:hypothetical protein